MKTTAGRLGVFLLIIAGIVSYLNTGVSLFGKVRNSAVQLELRAIDRALEGYNLERGSYPEDLGRFLAESFDTRSSKKAGTDPWSNPYLFEVKPNGFRLISMGPDGKPGGGDDVALVHAGDTATILTGTEAEPGAALAAAQPRGGAQPASDPLAAELEALLRRHCAAQPTADPEVLTRLALDILAAETKP